MNAGREQIAAGVPGLQRSLLPCVLRLQNAADLEEWAHLHCPAGPASEQARAGRRCRDTASISCGKRTLYASQPQRF